MSLRGNTAPPDGCPRGRSTAPAGCAAGSRMMNPRSGIGERPWMPPSSCWKSCNFSHEKTLPGRGWQIPAAPGQEAFLTPYLTTVRAGTRGNSGFKSVKKYSIPSRKCRKALQITIKNLVQAFGSKMPGVRITSLRPPGKGLEPHRAPDLCFIRDFRPRLRLNWHPLSKALWNERRGLFSARSNAARRLPGRTGAGRRENHIFCEQN